MQKTDVLIIGAGAAGLMCAIEAGKRQRNVLVVDHANKPGKKILMSGGGRCNFTNYTISPDKYLSKNPHFCKSALSRYTQWDFIALVEKHGIPYHEKTQGQLFCNNKSKDILNLLLIECEQQRVTLRLQQTVNRITPRHDGFVVHINQQPIHCQSLIIATGGLSIPTMGASPFGYQIAEQFGLPVLPTRAGLVPLTWHTEDKQRFEPLSGISLLCEIRSKQGQFTDDLLFTHRGLSGPAMLQISSYWQPGERLSLNVLPNVKGFEMLKEAKAQRPKAQLKTLLNTLLPQRVVACFVPAALGEKTLADLSHQELQAVTDSLQNWQLCPNGTEGYRTAEVTLGGVDTQALSSKTLEANAVSNLYFIGEVVDVTGWLGGYNFQWAWSSGWAAGQVV